MLKVNFYLDGEKINEPLNYQELAIELNFDKDDPDFRGQVSTNTWEIGLGEGVNSDGANVINNYIAKGLTGGVGVFEGIEYRIELENNGSSQDLFKGYLDLTEAEVLCDRITANSYETGGVDWLNQIADSVDFERLANLNLGDAGYIDERDYVLVPYVLSSIPDTQQLFTLSLSAFVITQELLDSFQEWQEWSISFSGDWLEFGNLLTLILLTVKNIILVISLIKLIDQIINVTIQPIKYHAGMFLNDLCIKASEYLGYEFESTILSQAPFNRVVCLPESYEQFENDPGTRKVRDIWDQHILGVTDSRNSDRIGYYKGSFGQLLRELKTMFNAKVFIDGTKLRLERIDYNPSVNSYQLPNIDRTETPYRFNFQDFYSKYVVELTTDENDKNTWQVSAGNGVKVFTDFKSAKNELNVLAKAENDKGNFKVGFAKGVRKDKLNFVERYINQFVSDVDRVVGTAERVINFALRGLRLLLSPVAKIIKALKLLGVKLPAQLDLVPEVSFNWRLRNAINPRTRIGALLMENDFINVPKLVMLNTADKDTEQQYIKVSTDNQDVVNAVYLYDNYHYINSFVGDNHNQHKIYTVNVPFCLEDYNKIKASNIIIEADGITRGEVISLKWNPLKNKPTAEITYKVREKYTNNLRETKILSDGR